MLALEAVLEPLGHQIVRASSGDDALRHVLDERFALILIKGEMPGLDGFETAALIKQRQRARDIPLIFMTAVYRDSTHASRAYDVGAVDYIVKPFDPDILRAKINVTIREFQRREIAVKQAEFQAIEERRREAERARVDTIDAPRHMKDDLLAMIAHELRPPLQTILSCATRLRDGPVPLEDVRKLGDVIHRNVWRQARLMDDLLDGARISSGKLELSPMLVDVADLVRGATQSLAETSADSGVLIQANVAPCPAECDPHRVEQIVFNLVSRAINSSRRGGIVDVTLSRNDEMFELVVADHGVGIAPNDLSRVFEPFSHVRLETAGSRAALGVALTVVRTLVELHGGTITVESPGIGLGSTFYLQLPRHRPEKKRDRPRVNSRINGVRLTGVSVLMVDDDVEILETTGEFLEELGAEVSLARSAAAAIEAMLGRTFDVIVSDISMPGRDGIELIKEIRAFACGPALPAIAISASVDARSRALAAGYQEFIGKPFSPDALAEAIARATQWSDSSE